MTEPTMQPASSPALGYQLTDEEPLGQPGSSRLTVCLPATPTLEHFDPEEMHVTTATTDQGIETWVIHHRAVPRPTNLRACAGTVRLVDRVGKTVPFFSFGGELRIEPGTACTRVTLCSPVSIIPLGATDPARLLLAVEAEALLAARRATWSRKRGSMDYRLACIDPVDLYAATLEAIRTRLDSYPPEARGDTVRALSRLIAVQLDALAQRVGGTSCFDSLDDIL